MQNLSIILSNEDANTRRRSASASTGEQVRESLALLTVVLWDSSLCGLSGAAARLSKAFQSLPQVQLFITIIFFFFIC